MTKQEEAVAKLRRFGFREVNRLRPDVDQEVGDVVMVKRMGPINQHAQIDEDGFVNGQLVVEYMMGIQASSKMAAAGDLCFYVTGSNDLYVVNSRGQITTRQIDWKSSGSWIFKGVSFHHRQNGIDVPFSPRTNPKEYEGGYVWDLDHGTTRRWGRRIIRAWRDKAEDAERREWNSQVSKTAVAGMSFRGSYQSITARLGLEKHIEDKMLKLGYAPGEYEMLSRNGMVAIRLRGVTSSFLRSLASRLASWFHVVERDQMLVFASGSSMAAAREEQIAQRIVATRIGGMTPEEYAAQWGSTRGQGAAHFYNYGSERQVKDARFYFQFMNGPGGIRDTLKMIQNSLVAKDGNFSQKDWDEMNQFARLISDEARRAK